MLGGPEPSREIVLNDLRPTNWFACDHKSAVVLVHRGQQATEGVLADSTHHEDTPIGPGPVGADLGYRRACVLDFGLDREDPAERPNRIGAKVSPRPRLKECAVEDELGQAPLDEIEGPAKGPGNRSRRPWCSEVCRGDDRSVDPVEDWRCRVGEARVKRASRPD